MLGCIETLRPGGWRRDWTIKKEPAMDANGEIRVTLSNELLKQLRKEAASCHVPLRWLVAGLVCDTVETCNQTTSSNRPALAQR
jgi:hypothetical protein